MMVCVVSALSRGTTTMGSFILHMRRVPSHPMHTARFFGTASKVNYGTAARSNLGDRALTMLFATGAGLIGSVLYWQWKEVTTAASPTTFHSAELAKTSSEIIKEKESSVPAAHLPVEQAVITFAPEVPPPVKRDHPVRLVVNMDSTVERMQVAPRWKYDYWTFNGHTPGPFIRARQGDVLEVHYTNKDANAVGHNIDFHAVTGPGGGAPVLYAEQNETKVGVFRLLQPGCFIYHCAAAPVPTHVANGMFGLLLVEPKDGLPEVDREFYVVQSEIYADESPDGILEYNYQKGMDETPTMIVFNGKEGALTEKPLVAQKGERVRIFFGNAGPNLVSSFHIIGSVFEKVYRDADLQTPPARGTQIALTAAGGASVVEVDCLVPGNFTLVDHSIFRIDKGAIGFLKVQGEPEPEIYSATAPPNPCPAHDCEDCPNKII